MLLEYEQEILTNIVEGTYFTLLARGISYLNILSTLVPLYCNEKSLVVILNMSSREEQYLLHMKLPFLTDVAKLSTLQRNEKYLQGGVFYGTARVFISDFVNRNINISKISTMIVLNAESILPDSTEAFLCYLFKESNKFGAIRAFSNSPLEIRQRGLDVVSSTFCLNKFQFFPRFHTKVSSSVKEVDFSQIFLRLPDRSFESLMLIEEIVKKIVINEKGTLSSYNFTKFLMERQTLKSLQNFKKLISLILNADSLSSYVFYKSMMECERKSTSLVTWAILETSMVLLDHLNSVFSSDLERANISRSEFAFDSESRTFQVNIDDKADYESASSQENLSTNEEEDFVEKDNTVEDKLVSQFMSSFYLINCKIKKLVEILKGITTFKVVVLVQNRAVKKCTNRALKSLSLDRDSLFVLTHSEFNYFQESFDKVIALNQDLGTVRNLESRCTLGQSTELFILTYKNSIEEQIFLQEIREEKDAFEKLIEARSNLPLRMELEKIDLDADSEEKEYKILVDSRETRAKLPFCLYKAGNKLEIKVIDTGDYLIGNNLCIERKAIEDLLGSLNSGRLYQQAQRMSSLYKSPILLVEFDDGIPTLLDYDRIQDFSKSYISRFCLFIYNFPRMKVLWSNSTVQTAKLIRDMQNKNVVVEKNEADIDPNVLEILLCIPGISSFNVNRITNEFSSLYDLAFASKDRLEKVLDALTAEKVFLFFRDQFSKE